jgi:hypothetical protein
MSLGVRCAAIALATALCWPSAARAQYWLGVGHLPRGIEVEVPADALPPGPALAEPGPEKGPTGWPIHRIRFQKTDGPARLSFWTRGWASEEPIPVRVWTEAGRTWETLVSTGATPQARRLFLGTAEQLAQLWAAARLAVPDEAQSLLGGLELSTLDPGSEATCRTLAAATLVIAAATRPGDGAPLRRCAARGANILAVGGSAGLPGSSPGRSALWGVGRYGWADALDRSAVAVLQDLARSHSEPGPRDLRRGMSGPRDLFRSFDHGRSADPAEPAEPATGGTVVIVLLCIYVLALACVGFWGVSRPRRAVALWFAFPLTAAVASAALAIASGATDPVSPNLDADVLQVVAPTGEGLERIALDLHARSAGTFDVSLPWGDGELESFNRDPGFGNPFRASVRVPVALEDRIEKRLTFEGIQLVHRSDAEMALTQAVSGAVPSLVLGRGGWEISNPTGATLGHVVLVAEGERVTVVQVKAGERRPVQMKEGKDGNPSAPWLTSINRWEPEKSLPPGTYLLAAESEAAPSVTVNPALAVKGRRVTVTLGPLPEVRP